ncbi:conserved protein, unknown function [Hepatocystis sp. ex Piliocolobus tephrosceles]|nr:conserved protein, unknown function [Hepatocystis sp. ex Piliocolobus tephrosceles]
MESSLVRRIINVEVPDSGNHSLNIILGVVNLFFFGIGLIVLGVVYNNVDDIILGILQLFLPVIGWIWAIIWGILIIIRNSK